MDEHFLLAVGLQIDSDQFTVDEADVEFAEQRVDAVAVVSEELVGSPGV